MAFLVDGVLSPRSTRSTGWMRVARRELESQRQPFLGGQGFLWQSATPPKFNREWKPLKWMVGRLITFLLVKR